MDSPNGTGEAKGRALAGVSGEVCVVLSTFPDVETARKISLQLVEESFAACANVVPGVESIYFWKGKVEQGNEVLTIFKLPASGYARFEARLKKLHPYEVPEMIWISAEGGNADYLRWVRESCGRGR